MYDKTFLRNLNTLYKVLVKQNKIKRSKSFCYINSNLYFISREILSELKKFYEEKNMIEVLAEHIADILKDYRQDEGLNPKKENVLNWIVQFSEKNRLLILEEMIHIFKQRYLLENEVDKFLKGLISNTNLTKNNPNFWEEVSLLQIQKNGKSQELMNVKFKQIVKEEKNIDISINDLTKKHFIHLDDFLFTGNRLKTDLIDWLKTVPKDSSLDIIYIAYYKNGQYHVKQELDKNNQNNIKIKFWRLAELENNPNCQNVSEVLWPNEKCLTNSDIVEYLKTQGKYRLRDISQIANSHCGKSIFSSETNRAILEKEFTLAGLNIISKINEMDRKKWKPLGISSFPGFGFGALLFSYRNCPNNTPLAFWWGDWNGNSTWYPLFQRKTYQKQLPTVIFNWDIK